MKKIFIIINLLLIHSGLFSQCDGTPGDLGLISLSPSTSGNVSTIRATASGSLAGLTQGLTTLIIEGPTSSADSDLSISGATATGLVLANVAEFNGKKYWFFTTSTVVNPSVLFPLNSPTTIAVITASGSNPISAYSLVLTDLVPPDNSSGSWVYNRSGIQVCNANAFEDNLVSARTNTSLPITLKSFTAEQYGEARASILNWTSSSEINGSHFEIERSSDAQTWTKIGTVKAAGNSTTEKSYEFLDRTIDHSRGQDVFYYRINKVDLDGKSEYTDIRSVSFDAVLEVNVSVYPTLTNGIVRVALTSPEGTTPSIDAVMYDKAGRILTKKSVSTNGITEMDLSNFSNGQYFIKMEVNKKVYTKQVLKVN
jgi:hypothetical protein